MSLYDRFAETKEQGFREHFIAPLLIKLGFINISNKHGSQEFGKDYVFSEIDGFGHYRHMVEFGVVQTVQQVDSPRP